MSATGVETTVKQEVLEMIQRLPDDCTLEDIRYALYVYEEFKESERDVEEGRVHTVAEARELLKTWLAE